MKSAELPERLVPRSLPQSETSSNGVSKIVDMVNHPPHYTSHPSGVECIQIVEHMSFNLGNAVKYISRAGKKDAARLAEDLKKARWYLDREISNLERT